MDFFAEQRTRTRRSLLLYGLFLLIVLAHMAIALGVMALLLTIFTGGIYHWALILVIIWTLFSFIAGSFLEYRRLIAGGRAIAQRVGAVRLFIDNSQDAWEHSRGVAHQHEDTPPVRYTARHIAVRDERDFPPVYRRYYEFAQQLAIASGLSMPILYVLPNEQGINGFVAGRHSQDMVMVVTQGALDKLSDEALYGLIGHEYGHILHGDAKFNLQLMVVLAGLQLLYDWSDSINNFSSRHTSYFDNAANQQKPLSQREIDAQARSTEAQTAGFTTREQWVSYWQTQGQKSSAPAPSMPLARTTLDNNAPRNIWTLLIHGLSFSSMASAQLIKHSFNRQRELLADATSVQLTRSPAILETLKAIHQDALGSRLSDIADINGLSHFFFASSGADLGDVSWLATHPSLAERMSAINLSAYHHFSVQVAKEKRLNQQKIKEIYEQRRLGDWGDSHHTSSNSDKSKPINPADSDKNSIHNNDKLNSSNISKLSEGLAAITGAITINKAAPNRAINHDGDSDDGLAFTQEADVIINGRLQVTDDAPEPRELLQPWQALTDSDLPAEILIADTDIKKVSLPHYLLNSSHHPLGAQALIEAVMLCHQGQALSTSDEYTLTDIWCGLSQSVTAPESQIKADDSNDAHVNDDQKLLPHTIDHKLLTIVARLDRRLDSALIAMVVKQLRKHDLSIKTMERLQQQSIISHSSASHQHYQQQLKCRTMLIRYQQGLMALFNRQLSADLTDHISTIKANIAPHSKSSFSKFTLAVNNAQQWPILSLWQALHLQQLLPALSQVLGDKPVNQSINNIANKSVSNTEKNASYQQLLQVRMADIIAQLDPAAEIFAGLSAAKQGLLIIFAYRLAKDALSKGQIKSQPTSFLPNHNPHYVTDLRRHTRLIDINLSGVSDANLQWLLLTAQRLNSIQLLAIIDSIVPLAPEITDNPEKRPQGSGQMAYNGNINNSHIYNGYTYSDYRLWLSTLHTVMLHDTIISQGEYDCLTALSERWLGVRQLFD